MSSVGCLGRGWGGGGELQGRASTEVLILGPDTFSDITLYILGGGGGGFMRGGLPWELKRVEIP